VTPEEWHKIKEVLQTAIELDHPARAKFLDSACAGEDSVRLEVESLLESHEQDEAFLEQPTAIAAADFAASAAPTAWIGRRLGPYELLVSVPTPLHWALLRANFCARQLRASLNR